jgi:hypothetical protein
MYGAMSMFSSISSPVPSSAPEAVKSAAEQDSIENSPYDIPKEDLMHLCMKMNKRMQAMEAKLADVNKSKKVIAADRKGLLDLIRTVIPSLEGDAVDPWVYAQYIETVTAAWTANEERRNSHLCELEGKARALEQAHKLELISFEQKLEKQFRDQLSFTDANSAGAVSSAKDVSYLEKEIERVTTDREKLATELALTLGQVGSLGADLRSRETTIDDLRIRLSQRESSLAEVNGKLDQMLRDKEHIVAQFEEKVVYLQMQLDRSRVTEEAKSVELLAAMRQLDQTGARLSTLELDLEETKTAYVLEKETKRSLQERLDAMEPGLEMYKERARDMDRNLGAAALLKAEQEALLLTTRKELKVATDSRDELAKRVKELESDKHKKDAVDAEIAELQNTLESMQASLDDKTALITRLIQESQAADRNHAMRTAMLATCEAQLASLQADILVKEEEVKEANERATLLARRLSNAEENIASLTQAAEISELQHKDQIQSQATQHEQQLASLKTTLESEMEAIRKELTKKLSTARTLLAEKEEEVRMMSKKNSEMQSEIASGAPNERRIFELAQVQARRDAMYGQHHDTREVAFQQIQHSLAAKDLEFARLQQTHASLLIEAAELRRTRYFHTILFEYAFVSIIIPHVA